MMRSNLPTTVLSKVWILADVDMDGMLDLSEFCLAMYLIDYKVCRQYYIKVIESATLTTHNLSFIIIKM